MSELSILLERRTVYGVDKFYPACEKSLCLAEIAGTKTITHESIIIIKKLGYKIILKQEPSEI